MPRDIKMDIVMPTWCHGQHCGVMEQCDVPGEDATVVTDIVLHHSLVTVISHPDSLPLVTAVKDGIV